VSSGERKACRLSRRGNWRLGHAIHMVAVTQVRNPGSDGRAYSGKKLAEGKTRKEALRALKRRISDALFARLQADARRAAAPPEPGQSPGGQRGATRSSARPAHTPATGSSGKPLPGLATTLRPQRQQLAAPPLPPFRLAALPREQTAGSKTGRSPAAQRRPQGVLDPAAGEPTMSHGGKRDTRTSDRTAAKARPAPHQRPPS
jgi:hypothetical protein